ncbi:hypothetical protein BDR07DRAFT_769694 [Suillus spraguei]|nr:hypothetical protein BDR07DRAFT_769694 [Suillus spraguei]
MPLPSFCTWLLPCLQKHHSSCSSCLLPFTGYIAFDVASVFIDQCTEQAIAQPLQHVCVIGNQREHGAMSVVDGSNDIVVCTDLPSQLNGGEGKLGHLLEWRAALMVKNFIQMPASVDVHTSVDQHLATAVTEAFVAVHVDEMINGLTILHSEDAKVVGYLYKLVSWSLQRF